MEESYLSVNTSVAADIAEVVMMATTREEIVSFLERVSEHTGDSMLAFEEHRVPLFRNSDEYDGFARECHLLHNTNVPHRHFFMKMWGCSCSSIKVRKVRRFSKCGMCEELRVPLHEAVRKHESTTLFK